ncbi:MAG: DUF5658 family protein [Phycisphaerales bacterium]
MDAAAPSLVASPTPLGRVSGWAVRQARLAGSSRPRRVLMLVGLIAVLSGIDLYLTLLYASTVGMAEANPLARALLQTGSPTDIALWKFATVGMCGGLLWLTRRARTAELGAWLGVAVLVWLMIHWCRFAQETHHMVTVAMAVNYDWDASVDHRWVRFESGTTRRAPAWATAAP